MKKSYSGSVGTVWLNKIGVPQSNIQVFSNYLNENFEKQIGPQIVKKHIVPNPNISFSELKNQAEKYKQETIKEEIREFIEKASPLKNKKEKDWISKTYHDDLDFLKIRSMLCKYNSIKNKQPLSNFQSVFDLQKYIMGKTSCFLEPIDVLKWEEEIVELFYITDQKSLDILGKGTNWCVLNGRASYFPFEYYLFKINGSPEALMHVATQELRDSSDGVIYDGWIAKMIFPLLREYRLIKDVDSPDIKQYFNTLKNALYISSLSNEDAKEEVENNISYYNVLSRKSKINLVNLIQENFIQGKYDYSDFNKLSYGSTIVVASTNDNKILDIFKKFANQKIEELNKNEEKICSKRLLPKILR